MKIYFDTGLLLKLYSFEPNSAQAIALIQSHGTPIILSGLQQTELRNALHRKRARGEAHAAAWGMKLRTMFFGRQAVQALQGLDSPHKGQACPL